MEKFSDLLGKTLTAIEGKVGDIQMIFRVADGNDCMLNHDQSCCERVYINDICGDIEDVIGSPLIQAEEITSSENPSDYKISVYQDSFTWTFYKLATEKGYVTIRWYGESNGYYSESVDFHAIHP